MQNQTLRWLGAVCFLVSSAPPVPCESPALPPSAMQGKVLLLEHGGLIEGDIERVGDRYRIRRSAGEMTVPASPSILLLPDKASAYEMMRRRIHSLDARQHAALAQWCLTHGLQAEAIREADTAVGLAPDDSALLRFVADLKARIALPPPPSVRRPSQEIAARLEEETIPTTEVPAAAQTLFATKVQPVLINSCASCHCRSDCDQFRLSRPTIVFGDRDATYRNLATVLKAIDRDEPTKSPLLVKALAIHGGAKHPPLRDRESPAYRYLEEFVRLVTGKVGSLQVVAPAYSNDASHQQQATPEPNVTEPHVLPSIRVSPLIGGNKKPLAAEPRPTDRTTPPSRPPVRDEFDPEPFNKALEERPAPAKDSRPDGQP